MVCCTSTPINTALLTWAISIMLSTIEMGDSSRNDGDDNDDGDKMQVITIIKMKKMQMVNEVKMKAMMKMKMGMKRR